MAESKGCAKWLRRVTRGGADSTSSPGRAPSNMRDWVATMGIHCRRGGGRGKLKVESGKTGKKRRERRDTESRRVTRRICGRIHRKVKIEKASKRERKQKGTARNGCPTRVCLVYFLADSAFAAPALAAASAYFLVKRSTRPAVSMSFCLPVKKGWQFEQISTFSLSPLMVERVVKLWPQAQCTVTV